MTQQKVVMHLKCFPLTPMGRWASIQTGSAGSKEQSDSVAMKGSVQSPSTFFFFFFFWRSTLFQSLRWLFPKWTSGFDISPGTSAYSSLSCLLMVIIFTSHFFFTFGWPDKSITPGLGVIGGKRCGVYFLHVQLYICATHKSSWILWLLSSKRFLHVFRGVCV